MTVSNISSRTRLSIARWFGAASIQAGGDVALHGPFRPVATATPRPALLDLPGLRSFGLFLLITLAMRAPWLGDPLFHTDEQFYLLVGDRMWHGALPYVDIWDRKPIGLFLIYGLARAFPGDGVLAYQMMAIAAVAATATTITRIAGRTAGPTGARLAGFAYLLYLPVFNCGMGQAPVFFNLPMILAAEQALLAVTEAGSQTVRDPSIALLRRGFFAMILAGLAIQIKTSVVVEGIGFGMLLLWSGWRLGWSPRQLAGVGAAWAATALLPMALALVVYAALSASDAFVAANFLSIFGRSQDLGEGLLRLAKVMAALIPFYIALWRGRRVLPAPVGAARLVHQASTVWLVFAVIGLLLPGSWYDHYAAPMLMPLAILAAPALDGLRQGCRIARALLLIVGTVASLGATAAQARKFGDSDDLARATAAIAPLIGPGHCLFVYEGDSALYRSTGSCLPTQFAFPAHLSTRFEDHALGTDSVGEVRRIMGNAPGAVVIDASGDPYAPNLRTRAVIEAALASGYRRVMPLTMGTRRYDLYARR